MAQLKIYGVPRSRAFRTLWMAKELGLDYENVAVDFASGETRKPAYLALNPNGHVPAIDDDGFVLWESMASEQVGIRRLAAKEFLRTDAVRQRGFTQGEGNAGPANVMVAWLDEDPALIVAVA